MGERTGKSLLWGNKRINEDMIRVEAYCTKNTPTAAGHETCSPLRSPPPPPLPRWNVSVWLCVSCQCWSQDFSVLALLHSSCTRTREKETHCYICVRGVCVCFSSGNGPNLSETSPRTTHTHTHKSKVTQSAQTPSLERFSPSNSQCRVPSCFQDPPSAVFARFWLLNSRAKNSHQRLKQ